MSDETIALEPVFQELRDGATSKGISIHDSFFVELINYSRHEGVRDLVGTDLRSVLLGIGQSALEREGGRLLGAGAIREVIIELCTDPFSDCVGAAQRILEQSRGWKGGFGGSGGVELPDQIMRELPDDPFK